MIRKYLSLLALIATATTASTAFAQGSDERAYTEGAVVNVSYIRTEPGKFDEYLQFLSTTYKKLMEEYKKAGVILDYGVYAASPRHEDDPDLILTVVYKNMAALDNLEERTDPIGKKIYGTLTQANDASAARGKLRTQVGSELVRELILK